MFHTTVDMRRKLMIARVIGSMIRFRSVVPRTSRIRGNSCSSRGSNVTGPVLEFVSPLEVRWQ